MAMSHRACVCRSCILAALGGVPRCWLDCPRRRPAPKRQRAHGVPGSSCEGTPWKQISDPFNYDFPMRAIMYSCYRERMNVPYRREPPIYYSCNYILQNGLTFAYPIAKPLNADIKFPRPVTVPCTCCVFSPRTCSTSAHSTISWLLGTDRKRNQ